MTPQEDRYIQASERSCVNPKIGKLLKEFNVIKIGEPNTMGSARFQEMIDHLFACRFCRKNLSPSGKEIFTSEMFWGGYFVDEGAKTDRKRLRSKLFKSTSFQRVRVMDRILKGFAQGEFTDELKKIKRFIED